MPFKGGRACRRLPSHWRPRSFVGEVSRGVWKETPTGHQLSKIEPLGMFLQVWQRFMFTDLSIGNLWRVLMKCGTNTLENLPHKPFGNVPLTSRTFWNLMWTTHSWTYPGNKCSSLIFALYVGLEWSGFKMASLGSGSLRDQKWHLTQSGLENTAWLKNGWMPWMLILCLSGQFQMYEVWGAAKLAYAKNHLRHVEAVLLHPSWAMCWMCFWLQFLPQRQPSCHRPWTCLKKSTERGSVSSFHVPFMALSVVPCWLLAKCSCSFVRNQPTGRHIACPAKRTCQKSNTSILMYM